MAAGNWTMKDYPDPEMKRMMMLFKNINAQLKGICKWLNLKLTWQEGQ